MISIKKLLKKLVQNQTPIGTISAFAGSNAPPGYLICDGRAVSRTTYAQLFAVIGTTYGSGDSNTTFNLPNIQGKTIVGVSSSDTDFNLAKTGGAKTYTPSGTVDGHTLTIAEMPKHAHPFATGKGHWESNSNASARTEVGTNSSSNKFSPTEKSMNNYTWVYGVGNTGGGGSHNHTFTGTNTNSMPPFLSLNYIIKATYSI